MVELLADDLTASIIDSVAPHAMDYASSLSETELQSFSVDVDGAVNNNEDLDEIADEISDGLIDPLSDTLADVQMASLESSTSVLAMQAAGSIQAQGFGGIFKKIGRHVKKAAKGTGRFFRENGKRMLKDAAGFALRTAIGLLSAAPGGVQQLGLGSLIRRGVKLATPFVKKGFDWIKRRVKEKAKDFVREGLRRVHQIADERIQALTAAAPAPTSQPAPSVNTGQAPWISAQSVSAIQPQGNSMWRSPAFV